MTARVIHLARTWGESLHRRERVYRHAAVAADPRVSLARRRHALWCLARAVADLSAFDRGLIAGVIADLDGQANELPGGDAAGKGRAAPEGTNEDQHQHRRGPA